MAAHFAQTEHRFVCPQLPASPALAMELACELIEDRGDAAKDWALIGSSLGGFYATFLAEQYGCRAALLNPAVHPDSDLGAHIGEGFAYDGETPFEFKAEYLDQLVALKVTAITRPQRYFFTRSDEGRSAGLEAHARSLSRCRATHHRRQQSRDQ